MTCRVAVRIEARPPSIAPGGPFGSPPSRSTPSHLQSRAPFGAILRPAPAVLGVRVCSYTSTAPKAPDSRSDSAEKRPPIPAPMMMARIRDLYMNAAAISCSTRSCRTRDGNENRDELYEAAPKSEVDRNLVPPANVKYAGTVCPVLGKCIGLRPSPDPR